MEVTAVTSHRAGANDVPALSLTPDLAWVHTVANSLVDAGRFVGGLELEADGAANARWWPMPSVGDRDLVATLVVEDSPQGHAAAAQALAGAVDAEVRRRFTASGRRLVPSRGGRRTVPHAWLEALGRPTPQLPDSLDPDRVAAFAHRLRQRVADGAARTGRVRLCLRIHEPPPRSKAGSHRWRIELLAQDTDESSLMVPLADVWDDPSLFGVEAVHELVGQLGRVARMAPELAALLDEARPAELAVDTDTLITVANQRIEPLAEVGVAVLLPAWWSRRSRVGLRAKAVGTPGVVTEAGFGMNELVSFTWEAALGDRKLTKAELARLEQTAAAKSQLVRLRGEWVQIDPAEVAALIATTGTTDEASTTDLLRAGMGLDQLGAPDEVSVEGVVATGWLGDLLDDALSGTVEPIEDPEGFDGTLRPYQQRGVAWLAFLGRLGLGACLADDMGLGKTAQLIATVLADPTPGPTLVVCPVSVLGNWEREIGRFAPGLNVLVHHGATRTTARTFIRAAGRADMVLTTYGLVTRDIGHLAEVRWGRIALDEAQHIKNPRTKTAKATAALVAPRRIALTGTPVENRLSELWSLMNVLNPGLLGTIGDFTSRFAGPIEREGDEDATELLRRVTGPFVLRRLKSDKTIIDDLPDKIEQTELCTLTDEQATLYQAVVDQLLEAMEDKDEAVAEAEGADKRDLAIERRGLVLAGITKLKQVCNHPAHFLGDQSELGERSGKLTRVQELLDEITDVGDKALCFTQYTAWGDRLAEHFARRYGVEPLWLYGGLARKKRDEMVARFNEPDGPPIFLLSLKAGGTGLNLTAASHVIHLDRWWNPAVEDQATDRAYRIGQRRSVQVHKLVSAGTIEERIDTMISNKRALAKKVVGTGESWVTELSVDELRDVISLRQDDAS